MEVAVISQLSAKVIYEWDQSEWKLDCNLFCSWYLGPIWGWEMIHCILFDSAMLFLCSFPKLHVAKVIFIVSNEGNGGDRKFNDDLLSFVYLGSLTCSYL